MDEKYHERLSNTNNAYNGNRITDSIEELNRMQIKMGGLIL